MVLLPKSSAKFQPVSALGPSSLVMYENDGVPILATVLEYKKHKYSVINQRGKQLELDAVRLHQLPGSLPAEATTIEKRAAFLDDLFKKAYEESKQINLEEIWALVVEDAKDLDSNSLTESYYGENEQVKHLALRLALLSDTIFFKRKKDLFSPRSAEVVVELKKAEESRQRKLAIRENTVTFFRTRLKAPETRPPQELVGALELLEDIAASDPTLEHSHLKEGKDLINALYEGLGLEGKGSVEERAFFLLKAIGHFSEDTNLALYRYKPAVDFEPEIISNAQEILSKHRADNLSGREDLTTLECFTIDDASTRDMDDALSIVQHSGGYSLGVHISDVAAVVDIDTPVDLEAKARATSIYCPDLTIKMLPELLSEGAVSLVASEKRACLSCLFEIDHGYNVQSFRIVPSIISVKRRLTYVQADELLEAGDKDLGLIYDISMNYEASRLKQGGARVKKKEVIVQRDVDGTLKLLEIDEAAPSRSMVAEMAVLANSTFAEFAKENRIVIAFRSQEAPDDEDREQAQGAKEQKAQFQASEFAARAKLKKSLVSFEARPHATLGLKAYAQVTSPIRRYVDLCNQRQLLSFLLSKKAPYTRDDFEEVLTAVEEPLKIAGRVTKESKRFWILKYLLQRLKTNSRISGTVSRVDLKYPLVELDEVHLPVMFRPGRSVQVGEIMNFKITSIDPHGDIIRLEEVK